MAAGFSDRLSGLHGHVVVIVRNSQVSGARALRKSASHSVHEIAIAFWAGMLQESESSWFRKSAWVCGMWSFGGRALASAYVRNRPRVVMSLSWSGC